MPRPNIVYIMADDMGWGDLGCYGAEKVPTPNMDRLATEGMRLRDAHSSAAVCTPSRYSVLTGRYAWRTRLADPVLPGFGAPLIDAGRETVATLLRRQGYATAAIGKWHLGYEWTRRDGSLLSAAGLSDDWNYDGFDVDYAQPLRGGPLDHGFDEAFTMSGSLDMPPFCFIEGNRTFGIPDREKEHYYPQQRKGMQTADWRDDLVDMRFAARAVDYIDRRAAEAKSGKPFFLYLTLSAPHRPLVPPEFAIGRSAAGDRGDMVCVVDHVVGEVLSALDRHGLAGDTLVILTSDNGARPMNFHGETFGHAANGPWRGQKADIWEGGHREPFIARWPGRIAAGAVRDGTVCLGDLIATCAEIVGAPLPADAAEDSFSMLPLLTGSAATGPAREATIHHSSRGMFSLRRGEWKLIAGLGSGGFSEPVSEDAVAGGPEGQLYDLAADPAETRNLWLDRRDVVDELGEVLAAWRADGRSRPRTTRA